MSTRGVAVISNRYFFIRYNAHTAGEWFNAAFRMRPRNVDQFVSFLNLFNGAEFSELSRREAKDFMDNGLCEVVWQVDLRKKRYRHHPDYAAVSLHQKRGRNQTKPAPARKRKSTKAKQQNPMGDVGAMMGDVNKTVMTGMGTIMGVKLAGAVIKMIPGGK